MPAVHSLVATDLHKRYGETLALNGFSLSVLSGTIHGLLGPNGAGKSTAVRALATLISIDSGTATIDGYNVTTQGERVRERIGLVGQSAAVDEILSGQQNLPVASYSGGMRRRLDIAASLILRPAVLFLDEPTTGLDPRGRNEVWDAVRRVRAAGTTVLLTTQHLDEADQLAERISIMNHGTVIAEGTPNELKTQRGGDRIQVVVTDDELEQTAHVLSAALNQAPETDHDTRTVTVAADAGTRTLSAVIRALDAAGIEADDLVLRRPTLDEVFLTLTDSTNPSKEIA